MAAWDDDLVFEGPTRATVAIDRSGELAQRWRAAAMDFQKLARDARDQGDLAYAAELEGAALDYWVALERLAP